MPHLGAQSKAETATAMFKTAKTVDTLSLSAGERAGVRAGVTLTFIDTAFLRINRVSSAALLPLPKGEGRGEGESDNQSRRNHPPAQARPVSESPIRNPQSAIRNRPTAFSLVEILVTVALLSFIIIGLVAMFSQTRRAFTSSLTQVDVLESGRSAADIISREMEQMATASSYSVNNFFVDVPANSIGYPALRQALVDTNDFRTNFIQEVFFLTRNNQQWTSIGYKVFSGANGIGTLYRYSDSATVSPTNILTLANQANYFYNATPPTTNFSRLIDGVVDFRIRAYDVNGNQFLPTNSPLHTIRVKFDYTIDEYSYSYFSSNSLPAYVEIELGILEDRALARYRSLTNGVNNASGSAAWTYLSNHVGQVHIFRQRVTIRNVNPAAYQ